MSSLGTGLPGLLAQPQTSLGGGGLQLGVSSQSSAVSSSTGLASVLPGLLQPTSSGLSSGLTSGGLAAGKPLGGGFQLGGALPTPATGATVTSSAGLQLGTLLTAPTSQPASSTAAGLQLGGLPKLQTTQMPSLQLGHTTATARPVLTATGTFTVPTGATTLVSGGLTGTGLSTTTSKAGLLTSVATTTSSGGLAGGGGVKQYTYKELEDLINKWSIELQGQEKLFLREAQQINSWDRLLAENGDKITELNDEVERVKGEQQRLDSELDLIGSQQSELEEILSSLEESVSQQQPLASSHHADLERTKIYQLAESVDGQLRRMEQDLKEIIEQMNSSNTAEDEESPMVKVVKILNAHADSLNWIDRNTALLRQKVDEVGKQTEQRRREQERSFRLAFDQ